MQKLRSYKSLEDVLHWMPEKGLEKWSPIPISKAEDLPWYCNEAEDWSELDVSKHKDIFSGEIFNILVGIATKDKGKNLIAHGELNKLSYNLYLLLARHAMFKKFRGFSKEDKENLLRNIQELRKYSEQHPYWRKISLGARDFSNFTERAKAIGICLRRRKTARLIVDLILRKIKPPLYDKMYNVKKKA